MADPDPGLPRDEAPPSDVGGEWFVGCLVGMLVGLPYAFGVGWLVMRIWSDCDIGINAGANVMAVVFLVMPGSWLISILGWTLSYAILGRRQSGPANCPTSTRYATALDRYLDAIDQQSGRRCDRT